jgi:DNA mismatch endonuclease (patch repair protein)
LYYGDGGLFILGTRRSPEQISKNMKKIKNKDTKIEVLLRKELWSRGLRYRKNYKGAFGKPDIAFPECKVAVFCDSEFWHGYNWGKERKKEFKSNADFWIKKIEKNIQRDAEVNKKLEEEGWIVLRFWGNEIKKETKRCADIIEEVVRQKKNKSR